MDPVPTGSSTPPRVPLVAGSLAVAAACALLLLATSPGLPMVWDEGNAILRAEKISRWVGRWGGDAAGQASPWSEPVIAADWPYTTQIEGHPAFYGIVIAAGQAVSSGLPPLQSARFGPIVLFALAVGAMFYRLWRDDSPAAALGAVAAMLLLPRLFAHAHFASFDGPLTSCWILAWASFGPALRGRRWALLWGIALGLTMSTKATGWLAPLPFLAWTLLYRDRAGMRAFGLGMAVALVVFFLLNPPLWHHPVDGWLTFFDLNLHRANHGWNISTQFLGRMYDLHHPLPWYNTLFWTAITVPLGILVLSVFGLVPTVRRWREERGAMLVLANWLTLMIVRALPMAPPHDGIRLFLPAFAFLAILAGIGTSRLLASVSGRLAWPRAARRAALGAVVLGYLGSATSLLWYAPQWLSYYNLLIGGLPGATAAGMEPTYYWDALDGEVLEWLHRHTTPEEKIRFGAGPGDNLRLMRRWGVLQRESLPAIPGEYRWYVLQHRPSAWQPEDRWLLEHGQPAFRKTLRQGGWGPWHLEVPLVEVYPYDQYLRAKQSSSPVETP